MSNEPLPMTTSTHDDLVSFSLFSFVIMIIDSRESGVLSKQKLVTTVTVTVVPALDLQLVTNSVRH